MGNRSLRFRRGGSWSDVLGWFGADAGALAPQCRTFRACEVASQHLLLPSSLIWRTRPSASGTQPRPAFKVHAGQPSSIATSAGKRGSGYYYVVRRNDADVELYIDRRKEAEAENKAIFDTLAESRAAIEAAFGESLDWQRLEVGAPVESRRTSMSEATETRRSGPTSTMR